jgi:predicted  nucleic acid-binding Zn-ribbon protein
MKEEIKEDIETLKNDQSEINNSISQINIIIESLVNKWNKLKIEYQK